MKDIRTLKRMLNQVFSILNKKQKVQMLGLFLVILIGSMFELLGVTAMLPFIQSILTPNQLMQKSYISFFCNILGITEPVSVIMLVGVGVALIYIVKNSFLLFSNYLQISFSNKTQESLSVLMMNSYMSRSYSFFVENGSAVILQGVNADSNGVFWVVMKLFSLFSETLVILSIITYLVTVDWVMALGVLIIGFICLGVVVVGLKRKISRLSTVSRVTGQKKYSWLVQISGGIKDILVYNRREYFLRGYEKAYDESCKANIQYSWIGTLPERLIEAFCVSGIILTILIRMKMGIDVNSFIPGMAVFAMGAFRLLPSIARSAGYINDFVYYRQYVEATYDNIKSARTFEKEQEKQSECIDKNKEIVELEGVKCLENEIKICELVWKYPEGVGNVLDGLNMSIHKGEAIGIIGESGSGKSTLADIILRLYYPQQGEIMMDGVNINSIPDIWSNIIGYVPQSVFLVDDTIRENVIFGADDPNDDKVWEALKKASLDKFVKGLPKGLDTIVGERGVKFSGGQRQRIAIARALYADPQIMILDEATSALDNETEEAVMEAIDSLAGTMTLIIIAHRVTTLKGCDKIYEIIDGKAIERSKNEIIHG